MACQLVFKAAGRCISSRAAQISRQHLILRRPTCLITKLTDINLITCKAFCTTMHRKAFTEPKTVKHKVLFQHGMRFQEEGDLWLEADGWNDVEKNILKVSPEVRRTWEALLMRYLLHLGQGQRAESFLAYIRKYREPNLATLGAFLELCGKQKSFLREDAVLDIENDMRAKYGDCMDDGSMVALMWAACHTEDHGKCLQYLATLKETARLSPSHFSPLFRLVSRTVNYERVEHLLEEVSRSGVQPLEKDLLSLINAFTTPRSGSFDELDTFSGVFDLFVQTISSCSWLYSVAVSEALFQLRLKTSDAYWNMRKFTLRPGRDFCPVCRTKLPRADLTPEEAQLLKETMGNELYNKSNWLRTNPEELSRFNDFLQENGPFSAVVDGLNVSFSGVQGHKVTDYTRARNVLTVVQALAEREGGKVCLFGRAHMRKWPHALMSQIEDYCAYFLAENVSHDDPFVIYAALTSGLGTKIVSGDALRDHSFRLGPQLRPVFCTWQRAHQMRFRGVRDGRAILLPPLLSLPVLSASSDAIHVNFEDGRDRLFFERPQSWVCIREER